MNNERAHATIRQRLSGSSRILLLLYTQIATATILGNNHSEPQYAAGRLTNRILFGRVELPHMRGYLKPDTSCFGRVAMTIRLR